MANKSHSHSKIAKGATVRQPTVQPSIPSKYQRILVNSKPKNTRFPKNYELKKLYNTAPGPGTYNHRQVKTQQRSRRTKPLDQFEQEVNRFPEEDILKAQEPGPADYDPEKPEKHKMCMSFYYKPEVARSLNMLTKWTKYSQVDGTTGSYARPITVNVYFKSENPPPGYYETEGRPKTQSFQAGHKHLFTSKSRRDTFQIKNEIPDVGAYEFEPPQEDLIPSAVFIGPTERKKVKINLYDPHKELQKEAGPGPAQYYNDEDSQVNKSTLAGSTIPSRHQQRAKSTKAKKRPKVLK